MSALERMQALQAKLRAKKEADQLKATTATTTTTTNKPTIPITTTTNKPPSAPTNISQARPTPPPTLPQPRQSTATKSASGRSSTPSHTSATLSTTAATPSRASVSPRPIAPVPSTASNIKSPPPAVSTQPQTKPTPNPSAPKPGQTRQSSTTSTASAPKTTAQTNARTCSPSPTTTATPIVPPPRTTTADTKSLKRKKTTTTTSSNENVNWNPNVASSPSFGDESLSKKPKVSVISLADTSHLEKMAYHPSTRHVPNVNKVKEEVKSSLWLQNIAPDTTPSDLIPIFALYGDVAECKLQPPSPSTNRCGLIQYRSRDAATLAFELLNQSMVCGRDLTLIWYDPHHHRLENSTPLSDIEMDELPLMDSHSLRSQFLHQLHRYKPHITVEAKTVRQHASTSTHAADLQHLNLRPFIELGSRPPSISHLIPNTHVGDTILPQRELVPYELFEYD